MKRIKVFRKGVLTNQVEEAAIGLGLKAGEADIWLADCLAKNKFGKPERWVTELSGEDITQAIETRQLEKEPGVFVTEYKLPAEYTIVEENIDAEIAAQKAKEDAAKALKDKFKNLKKSDIDTVSKLGDAFLDLLKLLDLK